MRILGLGFVVLLAMAFAAHAGSRKTIRQQTELSMAVEATIDIRPDGSVEHYQVADSEKIPPSVIGIIDRHVPKWKFEPVLVDGKPAAVRTNAKLKIIARPNDDGSYSAGILSANFSGGIPDKESLLRFRDRKPSVTYPSFGWVLMSGEVYIALKIGPDGKVMDGIVRRVDLMMSATGAQMAKAREILGDRTLKAVRTGLSMFRRAGNVRASPTGPESCRWSSASTRMRPSVPMGNGWPTFRALAPRFRGASSKANRGMATIASWEWKPSTATVRNSLPRSCRIDSR